MDDNFPDDLRKQVRTYMVESKVPEDKVDSAVDSYMEGLFKPDHTPIGKIVDLCKSSH